LAGDEAAIFHAQPATWQVQLIDIALVVRTRGRRFGRIDWIPTWPEMSFADAQAGSGKTVGHRALLYGMATSGKGKSLIQSPTARHHAVGIISLFGAKEGLQTTIPHRAS
jgi:hypothetical protein